jgi:hypothetical protein
MSIAKKMATVALMGGLTLATAACQHHDNGLHEGHNKCGAKHKNGCKSGNGCKANAEKNKCKAAAAEKNGCKGPEKNSCKGAEKNKCKGNEKKAQ